MNIDYKISKQNKKIETIIVEIISRHTDQCAWTIAFLKDSYFKNKDIISQFQQEKQEIESLKGIYAKVAVMLVNKQWLSNGQLSWISQLILYNLDKLKREHFQQFMLRKIPVNLIYVFDSEYFIKNITGFQVLQGKSSPISIELQLMDRIGNKTKQVKIIMKPIAQDCKEYRIESNLAQFFKDIGLFDEELTYKIFNISKSLIICEYLANKGNLSNILLHDDDIIETQINVYQKMKDRLDKDEKRLLEIYDRTKYNDNQCISRSIYKDCESINNWWTQSSNFVKTSAQWSQLGFVLGLGDRHLENILLTDDYKIIHIDLQSAFDHGNTKRYSEWIPFRLTTCLVQPLGVLGVYGLFYAEMINMVYKFIGNEANTWKAFSNFTGQKISKIEQLIYTRLRFLKRKNKTIEDGIAQTIKIAKTIIVKIVVLGNAYLALILIHYLQTIQLATLNNSFIVQFK